MASNLHSRSTIDGCVFTNQIPLTIAAGAADYYNVYIPAVSVASIVIMGRNVVSNSGGFKSGGAYPSDSICIYAEGNYLIGIKNLSNATQTVYAEYVWVQLQTLLDF